MKRFSSMFVALAVLAALGQAAPPDSKNVAADAKIGKSPTQRSTAAPNDNDPFAPSDSRNVPSAKTDKRPASNSPTVPPFHGDEAAERKIREVLNSPTQIEFVETPMKDVVDYLKDLHHIEIQLDEPALKEAGVDDSKPVTRNLKGISLRSALRMVLGDMQLKYVIHDGVLLITSSAKAESEEYMETRAYAVGDLVPTARDESGTTSASFGPLKAILTNTVAAKTWADNGGTGAISEIVIGKRPLLVILQTQEVHERIDSALEMLRKASGLKTAE